MSVLPGVGVCAELESLALVLHTYTHTHFTYKRTCIHKLQNKSFYMHIETYSMLLIIFPKFSFFCVLFITHVDCWKPLKLSLKAIFKFPIIVGPHA